MIWSTRARASLREIGRYIAQDNKDAAARWLGRLVAHTASALDQPRSGRVVPEFGEDDLRELVWRRYRIVYRVRPDACYVLLVFEGHRQLRASDITDDE